MNAGSTMLQSHRDDRVAAGIMLSGLGTVGILVASALPTTRHEELWLERTANP
jgi:hypothetical protein